MRKLAVILLLSFVLHFVGAAQAPPPPPPPAPMGGGGSGTAVPIDNEVALLLFAVAFYGGYKLRKTKLAVK